jgi:hypothetical protein
VLTACTLVLVDDPLAVAVNNCRVQGRFESAEVTAGQLSSNIEWRLSSVPHQYLLDRMDSLLCLLMGATEHAHAFVVSADWAYASGMSHGANCASVDAVRADRTSSVWNMKIQIKVRRDSLAASLDVCLRLSPRTQAPMC